MHHCPTAIIIEHMNTGGGAAARASESMTFVVIDRSVPEECKILEHLEQAGHRVISLDDQRARQLLLEQPTGHGASAVRHHDAIALDPQQRVVHVHDRLVDLSRLEFDLLHVLIESPRRVLSHGELAERVWESHQVEMKTIAVMASRLRRRIIDAGGPRVVQAVHGVGYRLAFAG